MSLEIALLVLRRLELALNTAGRFIAFVQRLPRTRSILPARSASARAPGARPGFEHRTGDTAPSRTHARWLGSVRAATRLAFRCRPQPDRQAFGGAGARACRDSARSR